MKKISKQSIQEFEQKYIKFNKLLDFKKQQLNVGDIIKLNYLITDNGKEHLQIIKGFIISIQNKGLGKNFILLQRMDNILIEYVFPLNSPKIINIELKDSLNYSRAKLYFVKSLKELAYKSSKKVYLTGIEPVTPKYENGL